MNHAGHFARQNKKNQMMKTKIEKFILPAYWATFLFNDDLTVFSEQEEKEIGRFLESHAEENTRFICTDFHPMTCFAVSNDANDKAGEVREFYFTRYYNSK